MSELKDVGQILKSKRIEKGLTISDVQEVTKIKSYYLQAIEEGLEDKLPDAVYVKGFIKSYAEMLDLNSDVLLRDLKLKNIHDYNMIINTDISRPTFKDYKPIIRKVSRYVFVVIIIGLFIYGFYWLGNFLGVNLDRQTKQNSINNTSVQSGTKDKKPKSNAKTATPTKSNQTKPIEQATQLKQINKTASEMDYQVTTSKSSYKLKIDIPGLRCWMDVTVDGNSIYSGILTTGQSKEFDINTSSKVKVKLGYAAGAEISIDGQKVEKGTYPGVYIYYFNK